MEFSVRIAEWWVTQRNSAQETTAHTATNTDTLSQIVELEGKNIVQIATKEDISKKIAPVPSQERVTTVE